MENMLEIASLPIIVTAVYWVMNLYKYVVKEHEFCLRLIPIISAVIGAVLAIVCYFTIPNMIMADNWLTALLVGGASGLSATGYNQVIKQLGKGKEDRDDDSKNENGN